MRLAPPISPTASGSAAVLEYSPAETPRLLDAMLLGRVRLRRPRSPQTARTPAETLGFSDTERKIRRETDSPLEGSGFELLVRGRGEIWLSPPFMRAGSSDDSVRRSGCRGSARFARPDFCSRACEGRRKSGKSLLENRRILGFWRRVACHLLAPVVSSTKPPWVSLRRRLSRVTPSADAARRGRARGGSAPCRPAR